MSRAWHEFGDVLVSGTVNAAAWLIDNSHGRSKVARAHIAMVNVAMAKIYREIVWRSLLLHGSLGTILEMPLAHMWINVPAPALADGPKEVHKFTIAKLLLREYTPAEGVFPSEHIPSKVAAAKARYADTLDKCL